MATIQELKQLLPFYVNGTLQAADCACVDDGLARSAELRKELDQLSGLAQMVQEGGRAMTQVDSDVDAQMDRLMDDPRMQQASDPDLSQSPGPQTPQSTQGLLSFLNPKNWHPAISLALVAAAVAQAGLLIGERQESGTQIAELEKKVGDLEFQLASGPGGGAQTADILVQIKPDTSWTALSELLATEGLTIVDGPSDNTVSLSSALDGVALDAVIVRLKASGLIETADKAT